MRRILLKAKIHGATVTETNLNYEGSLVLDESLMKAVDMIPYEQVEVYSISNGERFSTYLVKGEKDSGLVGILGAAVHKVKKGDKLIIASYALLDDDEIEFFMPRIVILDEKNRIKEIK
jgi:aspartate 1-decarboxylase